MPSPIDLLGSAAALTKPLELTRESPAGVGADGGQDFSKIMQGVIERFGQTMKNAEDATMAAMNGTGDPQSMVQALTEAEIMVRTARKVADQAVHAYQEIMRIQV